MADARAVKHGTNGSVYIKTAATTYRKLAATTAWSMNVTNELAEARIHEETDVLRYSGNRDWNISIEGLVDATASENELITKLVGADETADLSGATAFIQLRLSKTTHTFFRGPCVFTDISVSAPSDGLPTLTANLAANGAIVFKTGD